MIKILWPSLVHCNLLLVFRSTIFFGCLGHFGCHDIWYLSSTSFTDLAPVPLSSSASKLAISFPFFCLYLDLRLCNISNQRLHLIFDFSYQVNTRVCLLICSRKFSLSSNKIRSFSIKPSNRGGRSAVTLIHNHILGYRCQRAVFQVGRLVFVLSGYSPTV